MNLTTLNFRRIAFLTAMMVVGFAGPAAEQVNAQSGTRGSGTRSSGARSSQGTRTPSTTVPRGSAAKASDVGVTSRGFAVIELFTSEGCSSCPPADEALAAITRAARARNLPVYTLSFHVDYWDRLGWKDPYSKEFATSRQRNYARAFRAENIYTPQLIVNGENEPGRTVEEWNQKLSTAVQGQPTASLEMTSKVQDKKLHVSWNAEGLRSGDLMNIALVQNEAEEKVTRGENAGRKLTHVNVVRDFSSSRVQGTSATVIFNLPEGFEAGQFHVIGYVQNSDAAIRCVSRIDLGRQP